MTDLKTSYLGLPLKNPIVASASPLSKKIDNIRRLEDAGAAAVVLYSLFEEQIIHESLELNYYLDRGTESYAEAISYFPDLDHYNMGPDSYLEHIAQAKHSVNIPIIASLNGFSSGGWVDYASKMQQAGADVIELNIYDVVADPNLSSTEVETRYVDLVKEVRQSLRIPLAVKISPYVTALPHLAQRLMDAGANGLVLFNRFYQPDLDIENLEVAPNLVLSTPDELRLPLRWIAILHGHVNVDFALTSGVHTGADVIKAMMAGAKVAMTASELLAHGIERVSTLLEEVNAWMVDHEYDSIQQMQGSMSQITVNEPTAFERANYMKALNSFDNRIR